jgi:hypothetical protein
LIFADLRGQFLQLARSVSRICAGQLRGFLPPTSWANLRRRKIWPTDLTDFGEFGAPSLAVEAAAFAHWRL